MSRDVDQRVQEAVVANLRGRPSPVESGPFVIGVDPGTASPGINYATPLPGAPVTAEDVSALVEAFGSVSRRPRLEYVTSASPDLEKLLLEAGFTVEERHTYLVCTPSSLVVPDGGDFALRAPASDEDRLALANAQAAGFGEEASEADAARLRRLEERGGVVVLGAVGDTVASGGQAVPPNGGVAEVAGIATRPEFRRRGLAAAVTAEITRRLFDSGVDVAWLEASGDDSWRIYERIGYRATGHRLYMIL